MPTEMMIAAAILLAVLAAALGLAHPARGALGLQPSVAEMHQRLRGVSARLRTDLLMSGNGPHPGATAALSSLRPAVIPALVGDRHSPAIATTFRHDAMTVLYVPPGRSSARLASVLTGSSSVVHLVRDHRRCPAQRSLRATCGFSVNDLSLLFDATGRSDIVRVTEVGETTLRLQALAGARALPFAAGDSIVPLTLRSYYFDRSSAQLRVQQGGKSDLPLADNVVGFSVRYFGRPPRSVAGIAGPVVSCLVGGAPRPSVSTRPIGPEQELEAHVLSDGPWCGGRLIFDGDLLRVRRVRVELRLQVSDGRRRGSDRRWFVNPGSGRPGGVVPDLTSVIEVSPRAVHRVSDTDSEREVRPAL